ncbi:MAG: DUF4080 domain-containing protein [Clostridiaceae bacterium]|jgi:radical SAM superfamily enzyme YgiQ (UPF0313 family)|nr:DUF4080 domain-containing protein [Clostridiaceae bacterium]
MKTLLVAINSQYVHSNLAVLYLKAACSEVPGEVKVLEFSINESLKSVYSAIIREKPDVVAFSCYIWNIEYVIKLSEDIKKANQNIIIIAGGPEVSFDNGGLLCSKDFVDYIIAGEGEHKLPQLLKSIQKGIKPIVDEINKLKSFSVVDGLETLKSPYQFIEKNSLKNKIAYVESSRGCPFRCSYCMSSITDGVRFFPLEKVFDAIKRLTKSGTRIIKFVDRTFNSKEERALEIWNHIRQYENADIVFHFEIDPALLTEKMLDCLEKMPPGLVQLEAGIQSVHQKTLSAVNRPRPVEKAIKNIEKIVSFKNIHTHVDLIAGLPYESYDLFRQSFNRVYNLSAHHFQLGFLKLLRGSELRNSADFHGIKYRSYPPYEIISNKYITAEELLILKDIAECLELFYNSGRFHSTLKAIINSCIKGDSNTGLPDSFTLFEKLALDMREKGYLERPVKAFNLYEIFFMFIKDRVRDIITLPIETIKECLKFDYLRSMKNLTLPAFLIKKESSKKTRQNMLKKYRDELEQVLPRFKKHSLESIWHQIYIDEFSLPAETGYPQKAVIAFDFGDISPVTGLAGAYYL